MPISIMFRAAVNKVLCLILSFGVEEKRKVDVSLQKRCQKNIFVEW